jgi:hypothetical protein
MHGGAQAGGQGDDLLDANAALSSLDLAHGLPVPGLEAQFAHALNYVGLIQMGPSARGPDVADENLGVVG